MREMNEAGLYLMNGVGNEADFTFEHVNRRGKSTIDLMWLSHTIDAEPVEEWIDASIGMSDHALVTVRIEGQVTQESKRQRNTRWRVSQEWKTEGLERWRKWRNEANQLLAGEMWTSWQRTFEDEAVKHVGRERQKLKKHHEGNGAKSEATGEAQRQT